MFFLNYVNLTYMPLFPPYQVLCQDSGCIIVSVEYRLLPHPTHKLAPFDDGLTVTEWVLANKTRIGGHRVSKVGIGGDSAGGQISAVTIGQLEEDLDFQVTYVFKCEEPNLLITLHTHKLKVDLSLNYIQHNITKFNIYVILLLSCLTNPIYPISF